MPLPTGDRRGPGNSQTAEASFRVLTVALAADKLDLQWGERTTLRLEVSGLLSLNERVPLTLTNRSPEVIRLGSSEVERLTISPQDVAPDGTYRIERPVQSLRTGGFAVNARTGPARTSSVPAATAGTAPRAPEDSELPPADVCLGRIQLSLLCEGSCPDGSRCRERFRTNHHLGVRKWCVSFALRAQVGLSASRSRQVAIAPDLRSATT